MLTAFGIFCSNLNCYIWPCIRFRGISFTPKLQSIVYVEIWYVIKKSLIKFINNVSLTPWNEDPFTKVTANLSLGCSKLLVFFFRTWGDINGSHVTPQFHSHPLRRNAVAFSIGGAEKKNLAISQSYSIPLCPWLLQIDQIKHIQSDDLR